MDPPPVAIALRLSGQDHALEPGRDYLLGSAPYCDLRLDGTAAAHQARVHVDATAAEIEDLGSGSHTLRNGARVEHANLAVGDVLRFGDCEAVVVADTGQALIVPVPTLRAAARARRYEALRVAAGSLRHVDARGFQALVIRELWRAPWLAVSLTLHGLLLLFCLLFVDWQPPGDDDTVETARFELVLRPPARDDGADREPAVEVERGDLTFEAPRDIEPVAPKKPEVISEPGHEPMPLPLPPNNARVTVKRSSSGDQRGTGGADEVRGLGSAPFRKTVAELRKSGLEIVFVFDSTGSMSRTIADTKTTIVQMLAVLRALVPDARFGLVTYRDRGPRERYLVQQVSLGTDFWRACNFVQFVAADGGGDRAEDVRAGLGAAFQQQWRANARRVVVLAGDAPPHNNDWQRLLSEVRRFVADGRSFVHTIVTTPDMAGEDTHERFGEIAKAGKGTCTSLEAHAKILQQVLTLAFGREFDQDLTTVTRAVEEADQRVDVQALALARGGGPQLASELKKNPVPRTLLNALVRRPRQAVVLELIDLLADKETPPHSRHAIAAALQRVLELSVPPIDPMSDESPLARELDRLRRAAKNLRD
ncbi:MAG TPA: FHA domain-containing protein [Planctomycetota bacterium]|nr:FHA domain-containing protein [Planctomycetota bacterium]